MQSADPDITSRVDQTGERRLFSGTIYLCALKRGVATVTSWIRLWKFPRRRV
jgi:hypothetical protein